MQKKLLPLIRRCPTFSTIVRCTSSVPSDAQSTQITENLKKYLQYNEAERFKFLSEPTQIAPLQIFETLPVKNNFGLAMSIRTDVLKLIKNHHNKSKQDTVTENNDISTQTDEKKVEEKTAKQWTEMESALTIFLKKCTPPDLLLIKEVSFGKSSEIILDKIMRYETVHPMTMINELEERLKGNRRYYAVIYTVLLLQCYLFIIIIIFFITILTLIVVLLPMFSCVYYLLLLHPMSL